MLVLCESRVSLHVQPPAPESPALERTEGGPVLYKPLASGAWARPARQISPVSCPAPWPLRPGEGFRLPGHRQRPLGSLTLAHTPARKEVLGGVGARLQAGSAHHRPRGPGRSLPPSGLSWTTCGDRTDVVPGNEWMSTTSPHGPLQGESELS